MGQHMLLSFPAVRAIVPFIMGVVGGAFVLEHWDASTVLMLPPILIWGVLLVTLLLLRARHGALLLFGGLSYPFVFLSGFLLLLSVSGQLYPNHLIQEAEGQRTYMVTVVGEPQKKERSIKVEADVVDVRHAYTGRVLLYFGHDSLMPQLGHGDKLVVHTELKRVEQNGNPSEFNYARYLRFHHIHHQAYVSPGRWEFLQAGRPSLRRTFIALRKDLLEAFEKAGLSGAEHAVASALVLGYKADLEQTLVQAYAGAGATHVLAVSGLHVGIIYMVVNGLLGLLLFVRHGERIRAVLTVMILVAYALLTGLSPSVSRAVTMFSFVAIAKTFDRKVSIYNTLACSAFGLMLFNPLIVMQVGFQLSYAAVLGIVMLQPWLFRLYVPVGWSAGKGWFIDKVWEITCVSIAAQLATFPLGLLYFHQFPNLFFVSNLFVIPGATLVLILGLILFAAQIWSPLLAFVGLLIKWVIEGMNGLVAFIDRIPYAVAGGIDISVFETLLIYLLLASAAYMLIHREARMLVPVGVVALLLTVSQTFEHVQQLKQGSLTVYNIRKETAIAVVNERKLNFLASPELLANEQSMLFHVQHHWWNMGIEQEMRTPLSDSLFNRVLVWNGQRMTIIGIPPKGQVLDMPDSIELAVIHDMRWKDIPDLAPQLPDTVVLSSALGFRTKERIKQSVPAQTVVWDIAAQGAFLR